MYNNYQKAGSNLCISWQKKYLEGVCIKLEGHRECINLCENALFLKDLFLTDSFINLELARNIINDIELFVENSGNTCNTFMKKKWIPCKYDCYKKLHEIVIKEINSTAYILRLISNSILKLSSRYNLYFVYNGESLTGNWDEDSDKFSINTNDASLTRLILGFGPSASGKTYWANNLIKLFNSRLEDFPKLFVSIDGGLAREYSEIYQTIINRIESSNLGGLSNLVTAGMGRTKSIFKSGHVKKTITRYLLSQKNKGHRVSIYAPITLGGCIRSLCKKDYKQFVEITGDSNWIGTMIYQHREGLDCPYQKEYRCVGTTESGKEREKGEGKQYSSSAYNNSIKNGYMAIKKSKFCRLLIHNSGGYKYKDEDGNMQFAKSIITEFPINGKFKFNNIPSSYNSVYIQDGIKRCN